MASAYGTKLAEGFSSRLLKEVYDKSLTEVVVNRDYEGEINAVGSTLNILNIARISEKTYADAAMTADSLYENNAVLTIDQYKSFYWKEKTLQKWLSYIKNPHTAVVEQKSSERALNMDTFVLGAYADVGAGNRVGTDESTGSVTIDADGNVTGAGTAFTEAMEGRGFKAEGHTQWYRVKDYTNATTITIEDDKDDVDSDYTGGAIGGGATFVIEAATVLTITTSNLLQYVAKIKEKLDTVSRFSFSSVPAEGRFLIVPPEFETILYRATGVALHVPEVYSDLVQKGMLTRLLNFNVFVSNALSGNNDDGFRVLAGHPNWMTFAETSLEATMEEDLPGDFGTAYKDLFVYGKKVTDSRRQFAAEGFWKFS